jgi:hypothetical protein
MDTGDGSGEQGTQIPGFIEGGDLNCARFWATGCFEKSVNNLQPTSCNIPDERSSRVLI